MASQTPYMRLIGGFLGIVCVVMATVAYDELTKRKMEITELNELVQKSLLASKNDRPKPQGESSIPNMRSSEIKKMEPMVKKMKADNSKQEITFWMKVVVSAIFGLASLFIIMSKKYSERTEQWAVATLTLLGGVWIGTM